jgi:nicotinamide-nucleotide amidase
MSSQNPIAEILSQGEEVVTGQITDTNAPWLSQELVALGFDVTRHTAVGDRLDALMVQLREIADRADCCLCTGGLGPTLDDLTVEAVATAFGLKLTLDEIALKNIEAHFSRIGSVMPAVNRKQALLPQGALRLDNHWGTAPGFALQQGRCWFVFLPGVPFEMREMFRHWVYPELPNRFHLRPRRLITLRTLGIGESVLQARLDTVALPPEITIGFRAAVPEVQVKLLFPAGCVEAEIDAAVKTVMAALGDSVFCVDGLQEQGGDLVQIVSRTLHRRGETLAVLETASGGLLSSQCTGEPWFLEALVFSHTARLCRHFGLNGPPPGDAAQLCQTVGRLAESLRRESEVDYALAQIFIPAKDVGEVHIALATPSDTRHRRHFLRGDSKRRQAMAAAFSLDLLRRYLESLPVE